MYKIKLLKNSLKPPERGGATFLEIGKGKFLMLG
jgi:hypothetical protein